MTTTPESEYKPVGFLQGRAYYEFHQTRPHGQPEVAVYDADTLAQMQAELSAAKELLQEARVHVSFAEGEGMETEFLLDRIDAFLQEKP